MHRIALFSVLSLCSMALSAAPAQRGISMQGALELMLPAGARGVALGQAVVADTGGAEGAWWNPALLAWSTKREVALHLNTSIAAQDGAVVVSMPVASLGVGAISARIVDHGSQDATDTSGTLTGSFSQRAYIVGVTFSTAMGAHFAGGATYKLYDFSMVCSGDCSRAGLLSARTTAVDVGADYDLSSILPASISVAIQNFGPAIQFRDAQQRDPLPLLLTAGATYSPSIATLAPNSVIHFDGAMVIALRSAGAPGLRVGSEIAFQQKLRARAGYVLFSPTGSGPSIGLSASTGRMQVDIARFFTDQSAPGTDTPTYISLRYLF